MNTVPTDTRQAADEPRHTPGQLFQAVQIDPELREKYGQYGVGEWVIFTGSYDDCIRCAYHSASGHAQRLGTHGYSELINESIATPEDGRWMGLGYVVKYGIRFVDQPRGEQKEVQRYEVRRAD